MRQFHVHPEMIPNAPIPGASLRLPAEESRHLLRVLRTEVGQEVLVTDGRGRRFRTILRDARTDGAALEILDMERDEVELAAPRLVLACGVIKSKRWEWLLEKATELGVHRIVPLTSRFAEVDPSAGRQRRWETILQSAVKQSGRTWCPELAEPVPPAQYLDQDVRRLVCYGLARSRGKAPGADEVLEPRDLAEPALLLGAGASCVAEIVWCVGPEGGWSDDEVARLDQSGRAVRLGPHRLRAETAAIAGLVPLVSMRERYLAACGLVHESEGGPSAEVCDGEG